MMGESPMSYALIGVSVEPLEVLAQQTPATALAAPTLTDFANFSQAMVLDFYNFASSFDVSAAQAMQYADSYVPMRCLNAWLERFQGKMARDPYYWRHISAD